MSGKYIVVFKKTATPEEINQYVDKVNESGGKVGSVWHSALKGFSAEIPHDHLQELQSLQDGPIDYIEPDGVVTIQ